MWPLCSRRCWGRGWSGLGVRCKNWNHFEWSNWSFDDCHSVISQMTIYQFTSLENWPSKNDHSAALGEQWSRGIVHHFISSQFEVSWCNISRPFGRLQLCFKHWTLNTSFQTSRFSVHCPHLPGLISCYHWTAGVINCLDLDMSGTQLTGHSHVPAGSGGKWPVLTVGSGFSSQVCSRRGFYSRPVQMSGLWPDQWHSEDWARPRHLGHRSRDKSWPWCMV